MFDIEALYEAESVRHAVELMTAHPEAMIIAGGSDILIKIRSGKLAGRELVSIYMLDELRGVSEDADGSLRILPLTSFSHIERDPLTEARMKVLCEAAGSVGGPQIRAVGTIGGNICNGVTSADTASTLLAYEAVLELTGPGGVRKAPIGKFYLGVGEVDIRQAELLTAIVIPKESLDGYYGHYIKYSTRKAMDIATAGCSVNVKLSGDKKTVEDVRAAFGVMGPVPMRAPSAEAFARGKPAAAETAEEFGKTVLEDLNPRTSWRASGELRKHIATEMAARAFTEAVRRAGGAV